MTKLGQRNLCLLALFAWRCIPAAQDALDAPILDGLSIGGRMTHPAKPEC